MPFRHFHQRTKEMSPLLSPISDGSGQLPLLYDEPDDLDIWTNASNAVLGGETETQPHYTPSLRQSSLTTNRMTPASTYKILHRIGQTFSHVQYAVCGTAAMLAYGNTARLSTQVSIVCPSYAQEVIKSWAAATSGMLTRSCKPDFITVADADGEVWEVKIIPVAYDDSFETLSTVSLGFGDDGALTRVLTMPALVNQIALSYVHGRHAAEEGYLDSLAGDLIWLLEQIQADCRPEQKLTGGKIPAVSDPTFWFEFTAAYPELPGLFYNAGFQPDSAQKQSQAENMTTAQLERSAPRGDDLGLTKKIRPNASSDDWLRPRLRERLNMTRAEARKVMRDRSATVGHRSSGRWSTSHKSRSGRESRGPVSSVLPLSDKTLDFLFEKPQKPRRTGMGR